MGGPVEGRRRGRPPATDGEDTRRQVLEAAVDCFGRAGYSATSLRTIADEVGLTAGSLYHHFPSKEAMFAAAYEYALEVVFLSYEQVVAGRTSLRAELLAVLEQAERILEEQQLLSALIIRAELERPVELPRPVPYQRFVRGLTERAVARGEIAEDGGPVLDRTFGALLWGLSVVGRDQRSRDLTLRGYRRLIEGSFGSPTRRRRSTKQPAQPNGRSDG